MALENQRTLLEIDIDVDQLNQQAAEAKQRVQDLSDQLKVLQLTGRGNTAEFIALQGQMRAYQREVTQAVNVNTQLTRAQNVASGSIDEMRANLSVITRQYNSLSAAERDNEAVGGELLKRQKQLSDQLKELERQGGNTTRNVGNYEEAIRNAVGGMVPFGGQLSEAARLFNSLSVVTAANTATQEAAAAATAEATVAAEALAVANAELAAAQEALSIANAQVTALEQANTVSAAELAAADQRAAAAATELAAAQAAVAGAATTAASAQAGAAAATEAAAGGFKLFDLVLKSSIIGAIIGLILLLINYLKSFDPLMDIVEQAFAGFNAVLNVVVSAVKNVFTGLTSVGDLLKKFGDFLTDPIGTMKSFGNAMAQAARDAANLKARQQELEDSIRINEVKTAETQQRVSQLILQARNRTLDNTQRRKYLDEAAKLDEEDYQRRKKQAEEELSIATALVVQKGILNKQQEDDVKKRGLEAILQLQGDTKVRGKITDEEVDTYKKAQLAIIAAKTESTNRQEKIQNKIDADAEKAEAAAEKRAEKAEQQRQKDLKALDEIEQSRQRTAAYSLGQRENETAKINQDYDKRIAAARDYAKLQQQLERERQAALQALREDFARRDAKIQNDFDNLKYNGQQSALQRNLDLLKAQQSKFNFDNEAEQLQALQQLHDLQAKQNAENQAFELQQEDLTAQQIDAIKEKYRQAGIENDANYEQLRNEAAVGFSEQRIAQAQKERDAIEAFEQSKRNAYSSTLSTISSIFGQQSTIGKIALAAQRGLAIAEVAIQTQKKIAAIQLAAAYQSASAALTTPFPFSLGVIAGINAAAAARTTIAVVEGAIQVATILAQTVSGFAKGGVFYESDGRGGLLPGYSKHDNINAHLRSGEGIVVSEAMQNPKARAVVSAINVAYGGRSFGGDMGNRFAEGGVFGVGYAGTDNVKFEQYIERVAVRVAESIPQQILVVDEVNAALQDKNYIANRQNIS